MTAKTNSSAKKRFIVTGSGKIKHKHAYKRHLLTKKGTTRKRNLGGYNTLCTTEVANVQHMLRLK